MAQEVVAITNAVTLLDTTITNFTSLQRITIPVPTDKYSYIKTFFKVPVLTGTAPTLQADILWILPDGTVLDIYNNGTHTGDWIYDIGPSCAQNLLVPPQLGYYIVVGGVIATVTLRIVVVGYY